MDNNKLTIKDSLIAFISSFIICQIIVLLAGLFIITIGVSLNITSMENFSKTCVGNLILTTIMYTTMFLVFKAFNKKKENSIIQKPSLKKILLYSVIALLTFFCLYPIVNSTDYLLIKLGFEVNSPTFELNTTNFFLSILPMTILPAICEELLFRGLIFKGLKKHGITFSVLLSSILFAIYHMSIHQTIYPILFGALLAVVMHKENNILYTIVMHFVNNLTALIFMFAKINLFINKLWYYIVAISLFIAFITFLIIYIKKFNNPQKISKVEKNSLYLLLLVLTIMIILWIISNIL